MTDTQIRTFLAIARYGNFSKAADSLFISEPAVSRSIRTLEDELGCLLIVRRKGGKELTLTEEGKRFLILAEEWAKLMEEAQNLSGEINLTTFRIVTNESFAIYFMPSVYSKCLTERPDLRLVVDSMHTGEAMRQLVHNMYDIAIVGNDQQVRSLETRPIFREKIVLICDKGLLPEGLVHPAELDTSREIVSSWAPDYHAWCEYWFGGQSRSKLYARTLASLQYLIIQNHMWTLVPTSVAYFLSQNYPIDVHPVAVPLPDRICYAVQHRAAESTEGKYIVETLRSIAQTVEGIQLI